MKTKKTLIRLLAPLLALGLIAAACGDDEEPAAPDTSAADAAAAAAEADAAAAQAEADAAAAEAEAAAARAAEAEAALAEAMAEAEGAIDPEVVAALEAELESAAAEAAAAQSEAEAAAAAQADAEEAAAAAEAAAAEAMAEPEPAPPVDVTLQLQWFTQSQFAGYYAAVATGIYEDYGLNVEILEGGVEIVPASVLDSGAADFAVSWVPRGLVPREEGANITNIAQVFQRSATLQVAFADSGISTVDRPEGRTVGNWGFGNEFELLAGLRRNGLDPASDVQLVQQNFDMLALISGEIDAAQAMIYNEYAQVLETVNPDTGELYQPEDLNIINWNDVGTAMLQDALWADADRLDDDPAYHETAVKFVEASLHGVDLLPRQSRGVRGHRPRQRAHSGPVAPDLAAQRDQRPDLAVAAGRGRDGQGPVGPDRRGGHQRGNPRLGPRRRRLPPGDRLGGGHQPAQRRHRRHRQQLAARTRRAAPRRRVATS